MTSRLCALISATVGLYPSRNTMGSSAAARHQIPCEGNQLHHKMVKDALGPGHCHNIADSRRRWLIYEKIPE